MLYAYIVICEMPSPLLFQHFSLSRSVFLLLFHLLFLRFYSALVSFSFGPQIDMSASANAFSEMNHTVRHLESKSPRQRMNYLWCLCMYLCLVSIYAQQRASNKTESCQYESTEIHHHHYHHRHVFAAVVVAVCHCDHQSTQHHTQRLIFSSFIVHIYF